MAALKLVLATALLVLAPSAALRIPPSTRPTSHPARSPVIRGPQFWVRRAKPAFSPPLPVGAGLREVDRENLHPIFKLGWVPEDVPLPLLGALALAFSPLLAFVVPIAVAGRKERWERLVAASKAEHGAAFEEATAAYRRQQRLLIDRLLATRSFGERDPLVPCPETGAPQVIAVTMATGQEGQGVVRALSSAPEYARATILALVRNPDSAAAKALAALPRVKLVLCDSTDSSALRAALEPAHAVFLCTTLNGASAGSWSMEWDGGEYEVAQGRAFADACVGLQRLRQVVYGTAPMRKWPEQFAVEPPIHYAAKWRIEQILNSAGLPMTYIRKCPYHENFTKLTKAKQRDGAAVAMGVEAGGAFDSKRSVALEPGEYQIKALTPPDFTYNMMDPRDTGRWALLALQHPTVLVGQSLSAASDALTGEAMAAAATECGALGDGVTFSYSEQPRWLFEALAFVEPTFVYISGLQRWSTDGGEYDLDVGGVEHARKLVAGATWSDHLEREGLGQFTETMADLLPDATKGF